VGSYFFSKWERSCNNQIEKHTGTEKKNANAEARWRRTKQSKYKEKKREKTAAAGVTHDAQRGRTRNTKPTRKKGKETRKEEQQAL
jgi:sRNA-binding protein